MGDWILGPQKMLCPYGSHGTTHIAHTCISFECLLRRVWRNSTWQALRVWHRCECPRPDAYGRKLLRSTFYSMFSFLLLDTSARLGANTLRRCVAVAGNTIHHDKIHNTHAGKGALIENDITLVQFTGSHTHTSHTHTNILVSHSYVLLFVHCLLSPAPSNAKCWCFLYSTHSIRLVVSFALPLRRSNTIIRTNSRHSLHFYEAFIFFQLALAAVADSSFIRTAFEEAMVFDLLLQKSEPDNKVVDGTGRSAAHNNYYAAYSRCFY